MAVLTILLFILPLALIIYEIYNKKRYAHLPPGPRPLPILGNILEFVKDRRPRHEVIAKLGENQGDVFTLWFFTKPMVVLKSYDVVRHAYIERQHDFASRPDSFVAVGLADGYHNDLSFGHYTPRWQVKRRLFDKSIRALVNTEQLETEFTEIVNQVMTKMVQEGPNAAIDIQFYMHKALYAAALTFAFGKRFDFDDPEFLRFVHLHEGANEGIAVCRFYDTFPFLQYLPMFKISPGMKRMKTTISHFQRYLLHWFTDAREHSSQDDNSNMVEVMAKGIKITEAKVSENGDAQVFSNEEIMHMLMNLFTASTIPTGSATLWIFLEMILNPEIQEKCYEEIQQVTGGRRAVLNDRRNLPYVEATMMETLRHHSPVSLNVPHAPPTDATLRDYTIPAGTETVFNIWQMHHDPKLWKDPDNFNPQNFLDDDGLLMRPQHFLPFGAGRRICPGDAYAKNIVFLMFTNMLQNFRFMPVDGHEYSKEWSEKSGEFVNVPIWYPLTVEERNK